MDAIFIKIIYFCRDLYVPKISIRKYTHFDEIMNILDLIIILCCCPIMISGYKKGAINQVMSIVALIAGSWVAYALADTLVQFAIYFVIVCAVVFIGGKIIEKIFQWVVPEVIDRYAGFILGAINSIILLSTLYLLFLVLNNMFLLTDIKGAFFSNSLLFPVIESTAQTLLPNILNISI